MRVYRGFETGVLWRVHGSWGYAIPWGGNENAERGKIWGYAGGSSNHTDTL